MSKKKNPEQEQETLPQDQEPETEETQEQETEQTEEQDSEETQEQETEDQQEDEESEAKQESSSENQQPGQEPPTAEQDSENAALRTELLQAQGKLAAYAAGVAPGMIDDAVTLAMAEASKAGEVTEAAVTKAMEAVLKRHPEWKATEGKQKTGGFKLGADRDSGGSYKKPANDTKQNTKRWNRYKQP